MKPQEQPPDEPRLRARQLLAEFTAGGAGALRGMSPTDRRLLLDEKEAHLARVQERCGRGEGLHVNVPLSRILEGHVREIGRAAAPRPRDVEMDR